MLKTAMRYLAAVLPVILAGYGCAPAVRYTREQPTEQSLVDHVKQKRKDRKGKAAQPAESGPVRKASLAQLEKTAQSYIGVPYKYGGMTREGMDCSGFVITVYSEVYNKKLPRSSSKMWKSGSPVALSAARPGDLVFFRGNSFGPIDHVGIYMGRNKFIHASTSSGVMYSSLKETYFSKRFAGVRRVI